MRYWDGTEWGDVTVPRPLTDKSGRRLPRSAGPVALFGLAVFCLMIGVLGIDDVERECRDSPDYKMCVNDASIGPSGLILVGLGCLATCLALSIRALLRHRKAQRHEVPDSAIGNHDEAPH